jgi:hypothetical protein
MPGNLEAVLPWSEEPVKLRFVLDNGAMTIYHQDQAIASAPFEAGKSDEISDSKVRWGEGIFGPLQGEILRHSP